jgi:hypothetical protein
LPKTLEQREQNRRHMAKKRRSPEYRERQAAAKRARRDIYGPVEKAALAADEAAQTEERT